MYESFRGLRNSPTELDRGDAAIPRGRSQDFFGCANHATFRALPPSAKKDSPDALDPSDVAILLDYRQCGKDFLGFGQRDRIPVALRRGEKDEELFLSLLGPGVHWVSLGCEPCSDGALQVRPRPG
jgi:hypothetical protein